MRKLSLPFLLLLAACNSQQSQTTGSSSSDTSSSTTTTTSPAPDGPSDICWQGFLDDKIPVLIHYQEKDSVLAGEIVYLNTRGRQPIQLRGTIGENGYRLLEFEKDGNITGIITGTPDGLSFEGSWYAPKSGVRMRMELSQKDTFIAATNLTATDPYGDYHYQYSAVGYRGDLILKRSNQGAASLRILSLTEDPGNNLAEMPGDFQFMTVPFSNNMIIHNGVEEESCGFRIRFFNGFAVVNYLPGQELDGNFGHNATIEGVFLKVK